MTSIPILDAHVHIHPDCAPLARRIMEASGIEGVVNRGILEMLDIPFADGMRSFRKALGNRIAYFPTPDFHLQRSLTSQNGRASLLPPSAGC